MPEGGGGQSINLLVFLWKLDLFHKKKLKLLRKLGSSVTFGRVEEEAKHIDWGIFADWMDINFH